MSVNFDVSIKVFLQKSIRLNLILYAENELDFLSYIRYKKLVVKCCSNTWFYIAKYLSYLVVIGYGR